MEEDCKRILTVGEECISEKELRALILAKGRGVDEGGEFCKAKMTDLHHEMIERPGSGRSPQMDGYVIFKHFFMEG
jgi:hypothetical protein